MNTMRRITTALLLFSFIPLGLFAQNGIIEGRVYNTKNNEPVPFANIVVWGTNIGSVSDFDGNFTFTGLEPGFIELRVSAVGFKTYVSEAIMVTNANKMFIDIGLEETSVELEEVVIAASPFRKREESPVSLRTIGISEIEKNPGGNRDISRVIQSLPGVSSSVSFRNDVIVRGGGSSENRFYLDGVEIPNLNHFATQGASGGPVGIINVDFIREVNFYSGAFPANRGNALSSVFDFRQIDGNKDKLKTRLAVGASDFALTLDGPLTDNTTFVFSARRSYLQFLFSAIGLPFLPTYNDMQFKVKTRIDEKNEISFIGIGALDQFELNLDANETEEQRYILDYLPVNEQYNYTLGAVYKHYRDKSYDTWVVSHNFLNNVSYKYQNNIEREDLKLYDYNSDEGEYKFRYENTSRFDNELKLNYGVSAEYGRYTNTTFQKVFLGEEVSEINYNSALDVYKWGTFVQATRPFLSNRLSLSLGLRTDGNNFDDNMRNMFNQLSPRFSASYSFTDKLSFNANTGIYYQLPPYTALGFRDNNGVLLNKENNLKYIQSEHFVAGFEYLPDNESKISIEGFYKNYSQYPYSVNDSVAISSKGADFGTFGDEELVSTGEGRAYGMEILARHRNLMGWNVILSYTLVKSEFKDYKDDYIPTAWDNGSILNITARKSFKNNWDFGFKWRYVGGSPYTPYDLNRSSLRAAWDVRGRQYLDYSRFNEVRLSAFHQLDARLDKQFFFDKFSLLFYIDVQNLYNFSGEQPPNLVQQFDENGNAIVDPNDPSRYLLKELESEGGGTVLPTIGVIFEF